MLSSIDLKSGEPNWANFQNTAIDDAFRLQDFLGGDERSAAFTARPLGDPGTNVVIRLYPAKEIAPRKNRSACGCVPKNLSTRI